MRIHLLLILPVALFQIPTSAIADAQESRWLKIADNSESTTLLDTSYFSKNGNFTSVRTYEQLKAVGSDGTTQEVTKYKFRCDRSPSGSVPQ